MSPEDIDFIRQLYLVSALGTLLFTSMILRGLWRPLRFWLVGLTLTLAATPYFYNGDQSRMIPAFIAFIVSAKQEGVHTAFAQAGMPLLVVLSITSLLALLFAWLLPKPQPRAEYPSTHKASAPNPYLPDDFQPGTQQNVAATPKPKKKNRNPYLPDDFVDY